DSSTKSISFFNLRKSISVPLKAAGVPAGCCVGFSENSRLAATVQTGRNGVRIRFSCGGKQP
ncbi:hypothetical protein MM710_29675, partial [Klebsiella pneumoniae]|nr:hypothetical protein [Klebsiella pneumoniae]